MSDIQAFLKLLNSAPESIEFEQVMALIANNYDYQATEFSNGLGDAKMINQAGTIKIFVILCEMVGLELSFQGLH